MLQNKTCKFINDKAKIVFKNEKIAAFGGINFVLDKFDAFFGDVIDPSLGIRSTPSTISTARSPAPYSPYISTAHVLHIALYLVLLHSTLKAVMYHPAALQRALFADNW